MSKVENTNGAVQVAAGAKEPSRFDAFRETIIAQKSKLEKVLPAHITFEKFQSVIMTACMQNPDLLGAHRPSLLLACVKSATDGLLPDGRDAALVIFNSKIGQDQSGKNVYGNVVQYMPMYAGIMKKVRQSKELSSVTAQVVYQIEIDKGLFKYSLGDDAKIQHTPYLGGEDRGEIAAAYAIAILKDGTVVREVMSRHDIEKVRLTSKSGAMSENDAKKAGGNAKKGDMKGIWRDWYPEMARKTVFRRLAKWLPQSIDKDDIVRVFENDDTMDVIDSAAEDGVYTKVDEDGVIEDQTGGEEKPAEDTKQPDLKKEVEDKKAAQKSKKAAAKKEAEPAKEEEKPAEADKADDDTFPGDKPSKAKDEPAKAQEPVKTPFELETEVREAIKSAVSGQDLDEAMGGKFAGHLDTIKEKAPAAHKTLIELINNRMDVLNNQ